MNDNGKTSKACRKRVASDTSGRQRVGESAGGCAHENPNYVGVCWASRKMQ